MKKLILLFIGLVLLQSCNSENAWDCIQTVGDIVEVPYEVGTFSSITVEDDIFLEIEQGDTHQVIVTTGSNLLDGIAVVVEADGNLRLKNSSNCNFSREYDVTSIRVVTPSLKVIRNASRNTVTSINTLRFKELLLASNTNPGVIDPGKNGDFIVDIDVDDLRVEANGFSTYTLSGKAENVFIGFYDELPRLEAEGLIIQHLVVVHVSGSKMVVNPQQSIIGSIRSTGDVISLNQPPIVDVEEWFTGRLIFQ